MQIFFIIILCVFNIIMWVILFKRFTKIFSTDDITSKAKDYCDQILSDLNRNVDRNITLIDSRITSLNALIRTADKKIKLLMDMERSNLATSNLHSQIATLKDTVTAPSSSPYQKMAVQAYENTATPINPTRDISSSVILDIHTPTPNTKAVDTVLQSSASLSFNTRAETILPPENNTTPSKAADNSESDTQNNENSSPSAISNTTLFATPTNNGQNTPSSFLDNGNTDSNTRETTATIANPTLNTPLETPVPSFSSPDAISETNKDNSNIDSTSNTLKDTIITNSSTNNNEFPDPFNTTTNEETALPNTVQTNDDDEESYIDDINNISEDFTPKITIAKDAFKEQTLTDKVQTLFDKGLPIDQIALFLAISPVEVKLALELSGRI